MDQILFLQGNEVRHLIAVERSAGAILKEKITINTPIANPLLPIIRASVVNPNTRRLYWHARRVNYHVLTYYQIKPYNFHIIHLSGLSFILYHLDQKIVAFKISL